MTGPGPGEGGDGSPVVDPTYLDAIATTLVAEMERDPAVVVMGEDVAGPYGGAFKVTAPAAARFGPDRVWNMPMTEAGFVGAASGMALMGMRPVIEVQFADFATTAFDAIVQFAATTRYRWGGRVPWVLRAPADGGLRGGPFHSQNPEAWFVHAPGLVVVAPATPADAAGLLRTAIGHDDPVVYLESKPLYRSLRGPVPADHRVPLGVAEVVRAGHHATVVTYGAMRHQALAAADDVAADGLEVEVIDLRSLKPWDHETVAASVARTSRVLVVHAANRLAGVGAEVAAWVGEECFVDLDAPVRRLGGLDVPVPFSPPLEDAYRPGRADIAAALADLCAW